MYAQHQMDGIAWGKVPHDKGDERYTNDDEDQTYESLDQKL
jgi:hypothetical protein